MSKYRNLGVKMLGLTVILFISLSQVQAQEYNLVNKESSLKVYGTSSLHDWHIDAENQSGKIKFSSTESCAIDQLTLDVVTESLKSGKSGMDKNTYKALNTSKYKSIAFKLTKVNNVTDKGSGVYEVKANGDLSIAGTTKNVPMNFKVTINGSKIALEGEKAFKMTDFKVDPPTAMFGTITTGDEVTVKFSTIFK
ncbi:YceI family protein [Aestuariibaculum suncheonense]|uniref:YceI family protein n=1 Tax=Aestuariibaculum suncheonense TaxID=1028745 RepID=A0A8J6Q734_9FLAO|nr:YceI family protein [Aestuariibaculum suncheonense]MBD0835429.1 YceI family protein [Aestuariibaculum suncheonense]